MEIEPPDPFCSEQNEVTQAEDDNLSTNFMEHEDRENDGADEEDSQDRSSEAFCLELTEELQAGYKILTGLMAWSLKHVNWPFMDSIEKSDPELYESYKLRIEKPMWLKKSMTLFVLY